MSEQSSITIDTSGQQKIHCYDHHNERNIENYHDDNKKNIQNNVLFDIKSSVNESVPHNTKRPFKCQQCTLSFDRASQLDYHYRSVHLGEKSQICQICGKGFFRRTDLRTHLNIHYGTNLCICEVCGRQFNHVSNLIRHCRMHAGVKPYPCSTCGKRFTQISSLARHKRIHDKSKEKSVEGIGSDLQKDAKRQHYCKICGESFCFFSLLQEHEKLHLSNPGLFKCTSCKKDFKKMDDIKEHRCEVIITGALRDMSKQCEKGISMSKPFTNVLKDNKKSGPCSMQSIKELQSLETIVYITSEQLHKLNLEQKRNPAEDFLHQHLSMTERRIEPVDSLCQKRIDVNATELLPSYTCEQILLSVPESSLNTDQGDHTPNNSNFTISTQKIADNCHIHEYVKNTEGAEVNISTHTTNMSAEERATCDHMIKESMIKKGKYNKYLNVDGNELYIEILEQECSQFRQLQNTIDAISIEDNSNVNESYFPREHNENVHSDSVIQKNESGGCAYCDGHVDDPCSKSNTYVNHEEPTLRLVQTETGEQFYELIISNLPEKLSNYQGSKNCENSTQVSTEDSNEMNGHTKDFVKSDNDNDVKGKNEHNEHVLKDLTDIHNDMNYVQYVLQEQDKNFSLQYNEKEQNLYTSLNQQSEFERYVETNFEPFEKTHYESSNERFLEFVEIAENNNSHSIQKHDGNVQNVVQINKSTDDALDDKEYNHNFSAFEKDKTDYFGSTRSDSDFQDITYTDENLLGNEENGENVSNRSTLQFEFTNKPVLKASQDAKKCKTTAKKFLCNVCKKAFSTSYNYKQHIGTHFTDQQKFRCKECGVSFAWKSTLNKHVANNHRPDGPLKFVCEICPKVYSTFSQVNEHVKRDHLKERNHICPYCGKSFFKKFDLKTHSRTHTNERPYICRSCGKRFHHQSHIIRHERTHSGERPYVCDICQKTFTQPGSLKVHKQKHERLKSDIFDCQIDEDDPVALVHL